jgi:hypothetical protein
MFVFSRRAAIRFASHLHAAMWRIPLKLFRVIVEKDLSTQMRFEQHMSRKVANSESKI